MRSNYIFKVLVILMLLIFSVSAISSLIDSFGKVKTELNLDQSVTVNGKLYNDPVIFTINGISGNTYTKDLIIENHCNVSVNISAISNTIEGIDTDILYKYIPIGVDPTVMFPLTLDPRSTYYLVIQYKTNPQLKPHKYKITTDFIFS